MEVTEVDTFDTLLQGDSPAFLSLIRTARIAAETMLDGLYVIRTSVPVQTMDSADCVRHY